MNKKILLVAPNPDFAGGISRWVGHILFFYNGLAQKNIDLIFFKTCHTYVPAEKIFHKIYRYYSGARDYILDLWRVFFKVRSKSPDVLHIVTSASISLIKDIFLIKIAHFYKAKAIVHFHFGRIPELSKKKNWEWKLLKYVVSNSNVAIVIDSSSKTTLISAGFKNVEYLPNPISKRVIEIINGRRNIIPSESKILFVGQMIPTKGIYELVDACKEISNVKLKMIGLVLPVEKDRLIEYAKSSSDDKFDWLEITGEMPYENVIEQMLSVSVFVLPTYTEGFPNVILESMACGCPIVASAVGAIPEMLNENGDPPCGVLVEPKDVKSLKNAIEKFLNDKAFAMLCAENAYNRVYNLYSMESVWNQLENIWKSI